MSYGNGRVLTREEAADLAATMDTNEGRAFVHQNVLAANTIPGEAIDQWSQHYSGGLVVLAAPMGEQGEDGEPQCWMKLHDSWGGEDDVVVHIYSADASGDVDVVFHFDTGDRALAFFEFAMEALSVEVFGA